MIIIWDHKPFPELLILDLSQSFQAIKWSWCLWRINETSLIHTYTIAKWVELTKVARAEALRSTFRERLRKFCSLHGFLHWFEKEDFGQRCTRYFESEAPILWLHEVQASLVESNSFVTTVATLTPFKNDLQDAFHHVLTHKQNYKFERHKYIKDHINTY